MRKKFLLIPAALLSVLLVVGCPQEGGTNKPEPIPDVLVTSISIAGVRVTPLPSPAASVTAAVAVPVVVNTERPPTENESADKIYYRPVQPIVVELANAKQTVFFNVTAPGDIPAVIEYPGTQQDKNVTRNIGITLPNDDDFQIGQVVWIRVVAADESKTEYYKFSIINETHDTAINSIKVGGNDVLDMNQTGHIGPWICGPDWANAAVGLVNLKQSEAGSVTVTAIPRNNVSDNAKPTLEYAKVLTADAAPAWNAAAPTDFANHNILAVRVTASNGTTMGYLKITVNVGGSPFLSALTVNGKTIGLGAPSADKAAVGGAYRVDDGLTLTASPVTWAVSPVAEDANAKVTWALVAKGAIPQDSDFNNSTSFDNSHNYLYIKVVSQSDEFTMYYLVVYDERPRDTEHVKTGGKSVPMYRFTIPAGKTWSDLGASPKIRVKILQEDEQYNLSDGYQRNFIFGEVSKMMTPRNPAEGDNQDRNAAADFDADNLYIKTGGATFNIFMPFYLNKAAKSWVVTDIPGNTPAPNIWYIIEYPMNNPPNWVPPWDPTLNPKPAIINNYDAAMYWPKPTDTGDVFFGVGITYDDTREYWIKEISLVSEDGTFIISCDLLGNGRVDSNTRTKGFVNVDDTLQADFLRELVSDPTLK